MKDKQSSICWGTFFRFVVFSAVPKVSFLFIIYLLTTLFFRLRFKFYFLFLWRLERSSHLRANSQQRRHLRVSIIYISTICCPFTWWLLCVFCNKSLMLSSNYNWNIITQGCLAFILPSGGKQWSVHRIGNALNVWIHCCTKFLISPMSLSQPSPLLSVL